VKIYQSNTWRLSIPLTFEKRLIPYKIDGLLINRNRGETKAPQALQHLLKYQTHPFISGNLNKMKISVKPDNPLDKKSNGFVADPVDF